MNIWMRRAFVIHWYVSVLNQDSLFWYYGRGC